MDNKVELTKIVFSKDQGLRVIDRDFTTFVTTPQVESETPIDTFFRLYEDLYLTIPVEGSSASHEYLVKKSSLLYKGEDTSEEIQPLLDEIATLREELLEKDKEILRLTSNQIIATGITQQPSISDELATL